MRRLRGEQSLESLLKPRGQRMALLQLRIGACIRFLFLPSLCQECWPRWLMWRARMGYDLHHHTPDDECRADCLANMGGRRAQLQAQMSTFRDSRAGFFLGKAIDGQPTQNGTQLIMSQRSGYFTHRRITKQLYYESIGDVDELVRQILFTAQLTEIGLPRHMTDGYLLVFETFQSAYNAERGVLAHPKIGDISIGLHCVFQTGYSDSGENLRFINNWGRNWGTRGFGTVSLDYLRKYFYEAFVIRNARWGHAPWKFQNVAPGTLSNRQLRQRLMVENPVDTILIKRSRNDVWKLNHYQTMSPTTEEPVECLYITNGFGLRLGWTFLRHRVRSDPQVTEIVELFVWPTFRRMGIGTELERIGETQAQAWNSARLELHLHEADSVVGPPRAAARHFAQARGYEWRWWNVVAPRRTGTAIKVPKP